MEKINHRKAIINLTKVVHKENIALTINDFFTLFFFIIQELI